MGKAFRWLRSLLGFKKRLAKNAGTGTNGAAVYNSHGLDANKHAIAVAAAAASAAEAAIAAARAAAEVVRLTGANEMGRRGGVGCDRRRHLAAVVLQSAFRAYLARKALKALKGLVKLQALVRGHIVRKQSTYMLHRMQAMARIQARACAHRSYTSDSPLLSSKSSHSQHPDLASPKTFEHHSHPQGAKPNASALKRSVSKSNPKDNNGREKSTYIGSNLLDKWIEENARNKLRETLVANECGDDEKNDKVLEVDTWKPRMNPNQNDHAFQRLQQYHNEPIFMPFDTLSTHSTKSQKPTCSPSPLDFSKVGSRKVNIVAVGHAENSPGVCSASSRPGSSSGHPNYMTYTESSQAKVRSRSAPKQRLHSERPGTVKRFIRGHWDDDTISENGWPSHVNFSTIAYPGTDSLEKFGPFVQGDAMGYYSTYGGR